jgi:hypothetical protein
MNITVLWNMAPCIYLAAFAMNLLLHFRDRRVITRKIEAASFCEALVSVSQTAWCNIPGDCRVHNLRHGNCRTHTLNIRIFYSSFAILYSLGCHSLENNCKGLHLSCYIYSEITRRLFLEMPVIPQKYLISALFCMSV